MACILDFSRVSWYASALTILLTMAGLPGPALLAEEPAAVGPVEDEPVVEEIVVTALRRSGNLSDVPDSITVFDEATIQRAGITRLNNVAALTPNLRFSDTQEVGVGTVTIRGVTQNRGIGETPVAFVVDDVSVNNSLVTTQDLFDLEQVEVLRGPQGALYGRNSVAGAINIRTRQPTPHYEAYLSTRAAEGEDYTVEGAFSGPVHEDTFGDKLLFRAAMYYQDREGQLRNRMLDRYVDYKDSIATRIRLLAEPTDGLTLNFRFQYADQEGGSGYFMPGSEDTEENRLPGDTFPFPLNNTTYSIQSNQKGRSDVQFDEYTLRADYDFGGLTLTSISAYHDLESNNEQDLDQTAQEFLNIEVDDDFDQFSQELRLVSAADQRFRWLVGGFYSDQERDRTLQTFLNVSGFANGGDWSSEQAFFVPQPPAVLNEDYETLAGFAETAYDISDRLELTASGRVDRVVRQNDTNNPAANGQATFTEFQPKIQLGYTLRDGLAAFATYSKGFRPGGFNTLANAPEVQFDSTFDSETLQNYELGLKFESYNQRYAVNAAVFYTDYDNQQFFLFDPFGSQVLINGNESEIYGGEIEIVARPVDGLLLVAGYGLTESEIESIDQAPGLNVPVSEIEGNDIPNAPKYSLNLTAEYTYPYRGAELFGRFEFERRGKTYFTIDNEHSENAYNVMNLRLGVTDGQWNITGFVDNLTDENWIDFYFSREFIGLRTDIAWPSPPRQVGIEASYRF